MVKVRALVEPPEPLRGLEIQEQVVNLSQPMNDPFQQRLLPAHHTRSHENIGSLPRDRPPQSAYIVRAHREFEYER